MHSFSKAVQSECIQSISYILFVKSMADESSGTGCAADVLVGRKREAQDREDYERRVRSVAFPLSGFSMTA